jgi:hypothetical protein
MPLGAAGVRAARGLYTGEELPPGASVTVEFPISPLTCAKGKCEADGFVVFVGRHVPRTDAPAAPGQAWLGENALFTRAFLGLISRPAQ